MATQIYVWPLPIYVWPRNICMATHWLDSSLAISYNNLKIFTKEWWWNTLKTIFKQLKQFFIFSLNTQYMYGHAFTYVVFHLHLLEFIYSKLEFFSVLQYMCHVTKYCPTFFTLINILTSQYHKIINICMATHLLHQNLWTLMYISLNQEN